MKYCVIGKSLPHTWSPMIHTAFGAPGYGVAELSDADAVRAFVSAREYDGYNVTIPYKQTVIPFMDKLDDAALATGAVNTVVDCGGRLYGYNTDVAGMEAALERAGIRISGKNVLVLGSGGTAKTALYLAGKNGAAAAKCVSRSGELNYDNCYDLTETQVIINATPVGMYPQACALPIDVSKFEKLESVFDCIYNPLCTKLVQQAKALGITASNGLFMLVEQARLAANVFKEAGGIFSGDYASAPSPRSESERVYAQIASAKGNIVLIGMAGCGKSSVGRVVAKRLGREFIDTDSQIEKTAGESVEDIFAKYGERTFRALEKAQIRLACEKSGCVIATGGGSILDEENRFYMKSNGVNVLLTRDAEKLATDGRPLSPSVDKARKLFDDRKNLYYGLADIVIDGNGNVEETAQRLLFEL